MQANSSLRHPFVRRLSLGAVVAGALSWGVLAGERPAAAQVVVVAPPVLHVDVIPRPPAPDLFWVGGYWGWYGGRYVWIDGCWEHQRPGWGYERAYWVSERRGWRFAPGHWHRR
jgi:hypothetical protein